MELLDKGMDTNIFVILQKGSYLNLLVPMALVRDSVCLGYCLLVWNITPVFLRVFGLALFCCFALVSFQQLHGVSKHGFLCIYLIWSFVSCSNV